MTDVRVFRPDDTPALLDLLAAAGNPMTPASLDAWLSVPGYYPAADLLVLPAGDGSGRLLAARDVRVRGRPAAPTLVIESWAVLHPAAGAAEFAALLGAARTRAAALVQARAWPDGIFQTRVSVADATAQARLAAAGLRDARRLWTMVLARLDAVPEPVWPPGIAVRPYQSGTDDLAWADAFNDAFADHWGGWMGVPPADWAATVRQPDFQPALSLIAWDGPAIAGFCHCLTGSARGTVRFVGVRPAWRRQGLGRALTCAGLRVLRDAGMAAVELSVDGANTTGAHLLYADLGFETVKEEILYRIPVRASSA